MTGTSREPTEAHHAPLRGRVVVVLLAVTLLGGVGEPPVASSRLSRTHHGGNSDRLDARLAGTPGRAVREVCDRDPAWAGLPGWRSPHAAAVAQRPKQRRSVGLRQPTPAEEPSDAESTQPYRDAEQPRSLDVDGVAAARVASDVAWRRSASVDRASSLRAAFAAVVTRRGPPVLAGSRTL